MSKPEKDFYEPSKIEKKWQDEWEKNRMYKTINDSKNPKFYVLDMFPYPSGEGLHVGHPKGYIATDVVSRMKRMKGFNVLHPMGFDAFGLPAEQYAIKTKTNPAVAVAKNVERYKKQLEILGFDYDWTREVNTTDPNYYKWTQWIFLKLLEKGLAEERFEPVNWCPLDKTVLANEDVEDGKCERCGTLVEKKLLKQWVLKITEYADRLIEDLDAVNEEGKPLLDWPESIKESQKNWIGRSEGAEIDFEIKGIDKKVKVFTTRPDTIFGVTYLVLAPEHSLVQEILNSVSNKDEVAKYIAAAKAKTEIDRTDLKKEKVGIELNGILAINPANKEEVPIWIADYVLADYGTGAVMAVPAHDERDFVFAKKYGLAIKDVLMPFVVDHVNPPQADKPSKIRKNAHAIVYDPSKDKYLIIRNKKFGWDTVVIGGIEDGEDPVMAAAREVKEETGYTDIEFKRILDEPVQAAYFAKHKGENRVAITTAVYFELKSDTRVPIMEGEDEGNEILWVDKTDFVPGKMVNSELSFWLERINSEEGVAFTGNGILKNSGDFDGKTSDEIKKEITASAGGKWVTKYKLRDWVFSRQRYWGEPIPVFHDKEGKVIPVAEKDLPVVLPEVEFYEPTDTGESPLANISEWVNVGDLRRETNTMPQWAGSSWYYLRYMDPENKKSLVDPDKEKYWNSVDLYVGGAEHATRHLIYARFWHKFLYDIGVVSTIEPFKKLQSVGLIVAEDGRKMSKRWGNVVNPDEIVQNFGADSLRLYEMFMGPFDQAIAWNTNGLVGTRRFLERAWRLKDKIKDGSESQISSLLHQTIKKVGDDIENLKFNTAVSQLMILSNVMEKESSISKEEYQIFLKLLAPFAPHMAEELWNALSGKGSIHLEEWPAFDPSKLEDEHVAIAVQINGKTREIAQANKGLEVDDIRKIVEVLPGVKKWLEGKGIKKVIWVKDRIINFIVE